MDPNLRNQETRLEGLAGGQLKQLQAAELILLEEFINVCDEMGLVYYVLFGTLLGAVRHRGFIPWDDDIDVAMPRKDYDILRGSGDRFAPPLFLQTPENDRGACPRFMSLRNSGTTYVRNGMISGLTGYGHMGCGIDILPLDGAPSGRAADITRNLADKIHKLRVKRAAVEQGQWGRFPMWKKLLSFPGLFSPFSYKALTDMYHRVCSIESKRIESKSIEGQRSRYYIIPVMRDRILLEKIWFKDRVSLDFEHLRIAAPAGYADIIRALYGGAVTPPAEEQTPKHTAVFYPNIPYATYMRRYTDIFADLSDNTVLLFGAGGVMKSYMRQFRRRRKPAAVFDNDPAKWGKTIHGIYVRPPECLYEYPEARIIITSLYHAEIGRQLENMGLNNYFVFVDGWEY
ncbi:MAG: LicD family protein [Clostridiales bacterium]|jgi:lipopolysaccharide cholinephosphotransferase|nr:LicD family protein [Clostridiales bacterium]